MLNESGIFIVNAYRNENSLKLFTSLLLTPKVFERIECPYDAYIFTPSLFFINPDMWVENCLRILYAHFVHL